MDAHRESAVREELDPTLARRAALARILAARAGPILETVVTEALRATNFVGLGHDAAARYAGTARQSMPLALAALAADDAERTRLLAQSAAYVDELTGRGIPGLVQRGMVSFGFKLATGAVRQGAAAEGFTAAELETELGEFQRLLEKRIFKL